MKTLLLRRRWTCGLFIALLLLGATQAGRTQPAAKRAVTHADYDTWRTIQGPQLSRDGKFLAYTLSPQVGDRELVIRNLESGQEWRFATGGVAGGTGEGAPAPDEELDEDADQQPAPVGPVRGVKGGFALGGGRIAFTADNRRALFLASPTKAVLDDARKEKKTPAEMPKAKLGIIELASGKVTWIDGVRAFQMPEDAAGFVAYQKGTLRDAKEDGKGDTPAVGKGGKGGFKGKGTKGTKGGPGAATITPTFGSELTLRNLTDNSERTFDDVSDYQFTKDGKLLVLVIASKKDESNGVYIVRPVDSGAPTPILAGKGRCTRPVWDEKQMQLAFLSSRDDAASTPPKYKAYHWQRKDPTRVVTTAVQPMGDAANVAAELVSPATAGMRPGWVVRTGAVGFSADGTKLSLATGPPPAEKKPAAKDANPEERVVVELWHWKDEFIQPMQKVRGNRDADPSYRAVYDFADKRLCQLADEDVPNIDLRKDGRFAHGAVDKPYRPLVGFDANYSDHYLVNTKDGTRKKILTKHEGGVTWSAGGKYLLYHQAKHWHVLNVADGKTTDLTTKLSVKFWNEDADTPSTPPSFGQAGWTADDKHVVLYDQYDVWLLDADGGGAKNLTGGAGRKTKTQFRIVRLGEPERALDLQKPLLLKAENLDTRDQGFYRLDPPLAPAGRGVGGEGARLVNLITAARAFGFPIKAKDADVLVLTSSTFYDAPDLMVTNSDFRELKCVTNANPQKDSINWGKAELVRYKSADGTPLSGMLIKPENFDPQKKYPMIVYIYEKLSQGVHQFTPPNAATSINATYYASNGYLVLKPDIVYKVGYPGQSALKCVLPAIQAVVDMGCVDEKAIGIQGHSWGGYQIAYMVTQTNRFAAAAAGAPVSNMISAYGGIRWDTGLPRQFQYERTQSRIGGNLWQYPMRFVENSPIFMADRVQTPLLMLHNDQDGAVPWYQGIEYYLALRRLGKEVYMFNYNGEKHGLTKKANQRDYTVRMQQFFDHHLRAAPMPEWMARGIPYRGAGTVPKEAAGKVQ
jgi:dipeptidyl aminopeptidase/acylaminoacyl peptidase